MNLRTIKSDEDHKRAMQRISDLMSEEQNSTEEEVELEILAILVDAYESVRYPNENLDPIETIKFRMDQMQWKE